MSEAVLIAIFSGVVNGAVMWGVMSTKLQWLRTDVDDLSERLEYMERRNYAAHK